MHQLPRADHAPAPPSRSFTSSARPTPSWPPASPSRPFARSWASPSRPAPATFHRWINQYGGMKANDARRLPELERENARLKQRARDPARDPALLKEAVRLVGRNSTSSLLARRGAVWPATTCRRRWRARRGGRVACSVSRGDLPPVYVPVAMRVGPRFRSSAGLSSGALRGGISRGFGGRAPKDRQRPANAAGV